MPDTIRGLSIGSILLLAVAGGAWAQPADPESDPPGQSIDVAIALDTSGSMKSLIDGARLKLWEIVQEMALTEPAPRLRVALLSYGRKDQHQTGWARLETDLTSDLDLVAERLFALDSEGGNEYVGRVLQMAFESLSWSDSRDALKLVFLAGNEPADQDPLVDFRDMSDVGRREGIFLHAIFCGDAENPNAETWKELSELAQGQFAAIDHRTGTVVVTSPVDEELAALSAEINETFLPLGEEGAKRHENLLQQDENALQLSPAAAASRALVKASALYSADWDLIDAVETGKLDLFAMDESELPESLRGLSADELEFEIDELRLKREELRRRIAGLGAERRKYVAEQMKAKGLDESRAFDTAVRRALKQRLEEHGLRLSDR